LDQIHLLANGVCGHGHEVQAATEFHAQSEGLSASRTALANDPPKDRSLPQRPAGIRA
jgi:hypothetical protein